MERVVGVGLAGGSGLRARPISLVSQDGIRSKATMRFLGRPLIDWQVDTLREQGISDFHVIAKGRANRYQIKEILGHGERHGARVRYSRVRLDGINTGSGGATLDNLEVWDLSGLALIFPTDSVFEFDLAEMVHAHRRSGALVTIASVTRTAAEVAGKYGVLRTDRQGWANEFLEKPPHHALRQIARADEPVHTNAGMYLVDTEGLRALARGPLAQRRRQSLDWGGDLLPWLIAHGAAVRAHAVGRLGDLGSPRDYLDTMCEALGGEYPSLGKILGPASPDGVRVHESSLTRTDRISGLTLAEKLARGMVRIGPGVRIGREVEIAPGVSVSHSDIDDGVELGTHCQVHGTACQDGALVGPGAVLLDSYVGLMATVESTVDNPTRLDGYTALGDEVTVRAGTHLTAATIFPGLTIDPGNPVPAGATITSTDDLTPALPPEVWRG